MAGFKVPMTLRDFFFNDPFLKSTWDDSEKVKENIFSESRDMWKRFEDEFSQMASSMSSDMLQSSSSIEKDVVHSSNMASDMVQSSSNMSNNTLQSANQFTESSSNKKTVESESKEDDIMVGSSGGWMMPRRWMMPSMFNMNFAKHLDLFQSKDSDVIRVKDDEEKFEVSLDTSQYQPDELRVNVVDGVVSVEGRHKDKSDDGMVSRQFSRKYSLPATAKPDSVVSNLSSDGVLVVSCPKTQAVTSGERKVPIESK